MSKPATCVSSTHAVADGVLRGFSTYANDQVYSTEHAIAAKRFDLFGRVAEQRAQDFVSIRAQSWGGTDHFAGGAAHCPRHARMSSFTDFRMLQFNQETSLA